jgi:hypothetical protein
MIDWIVEVENVAPPVEDMRKKMAWMTYSSCCGATGRENDDAGYKSMGRSRRKPDMWAFNVAGCQACGNCK